MKPLLLASAVSLFLPLQAGVPSASNAEGKWAQILSLDALDDRLTFKLSLYHDKTVGIRYFIKIACQAGCAAANVYSDDDLGFAGFAGALSLGDEFVVIWDVADGMFVQVYHLTGKAITKVLEETTRSTWPIITESGGSRAIILGDKTIGEILDGDKEPVHRVSGKLYVWNGKTYRPSSR